MKILWKSAHPGMPTGYGQQSALILPRLKALGHELAVVITHGQENHASYWNGIPVFGASGYTSIGEDTVGGDYERFGADLVVTFFCTWQAQFPATVAEHAHPAPDERGLRPDVVGGLRDRRGHRGDARGHVTAPAGRSCAPGARPAHAPTTSANHWTRCTCRTG